MRFCERRLTKGHLRGKGSDHERLVFEGQRRLGLLADQKAYLKRIAEGRSFFSVCASLFSSPLGIRSLGPPSDVVASHYSMHALRLGLPRPRMALLLVAFLLGLLIGPSLASSDPSLRTLTRSGTLLCSHLLRILYHQLATEKIDTCFCSQLALPLLLFICILPLDCALESL